MKQNRKQSSEKDSKKNKKIDYNDYILLKNSFIEIGEKYKKLKEENENNNKLLKEYQNKINKIKN
jgi:hypothetical protein